MTDPITAGWILLLFSNASPSVVVQSGPFRNRETCQFVATELMKDSGFYRNGACVSQDGRIYIRVKK